MPFKSAKKTLPVMALLILYIGMYPSYAGENVSSGGYTIRWDPNDLVHGAVGEAEHVHFGKGVATDIAKLKYDGTTGAAWGNAPALTAKQQQTIKKRFSKVLAKIAKYWQLKGVTDTFWGKLLGATTGAGANIATNVIKRVLQITGTLGAKALSTGKIFLKIAASTPVGAVLEVLCNPTSLGRMDTVSECFPVVNTFLPKALLALTQQVNTLGAYSCYLQKRKQEGVALNSIQLDDLQKQIARVGANIRTINTKVEDLLYPGPCARAFPEFAAFKAYRDSLAKITYDNITINSNAYTCDSNGMFAVNTDKVSPDVSDSAGVTCIDVGPEGGAVVAGQPTGLQCTWDGTDGKTCPVRAQTASAPYIEDSNVFATMVSTVSTDPNTSDLQCLTDQAFDAEWDAFSSVVADPVGILSVPVLDGSTCSAAPPVDSTVPEGGDSGQCKCECDVNGALTWIYGPAYLANTPFDCTSISSSGGSSCAGWGGTGAPLNCQSAP